MTPQLETVEEIFHAALDQEPDKLGAFLDKECAGGEVLRGKVEELLAAHWQAGNFIETPIAAYATSIIKGSGTDLLIGETIGHYKISKRIGAGGMGEVYLATDTIAGRKAALKFLPTGFTGDAERLKRFQQEARVVAGLNHPNVLTVYEIGAHNSTHYIASELIQGETLRQHLVRGRMQLNEAIEIAIQVASALAAAHEVGIVHRDVKPENIMLRPDGYVKVLDFGIAKLAEQEVPVTVAEEEALLLVETHLGSVLGTVRYMSPEQARGASVDKRTDIWSLGVVLYEMLTGLAPFKGDTAREVMASILTAEPLPLANYMAQAPGALQQIVSKALQKDPRQRYQDASEMLDALKGLRRKLEFAAELERSAPTRLWLRWTRSPTALLVILLVGALVLAFPLYWLRSPPTNAPLEKSIAVLPFQNLSKDPENAFFTDGMQDEILSRLSKVAGLKVISRASSQRFAGTPGDVRKIGQALGVANILQGSVQKAADEARVTVQLIDARNDKHVWAETHDRKLSDIFQVETEIARNIAARLEAKLTHREAQAVAAQPTSNPAAYELYLKGRYFWNKRNPEGFRKALDFFTQATKLDPNYAQAYAGIADTYGVMPTYDLCSGKECFPLGRAAALKALELDDSLAEAHAAYAGLLCNDYKYAEARGHLERAIDLDPNYAIAHEVLGLEVLINLGEVNRGLAELRRAQELDPLSLIVNTLLGMGHYRLHEYDQAEAQLRKTLELDPNFHLAREILAQTLDLQGRFEEAIAECRKALETSDAPGIVATLGHAYAREGNRNEAVNVLEQLKNESQKRTVAAVNFAWVYIALGDNEEALNWLEKGYDDGSLYGIRVDPFLDPLRDEPRFKQLVARVFSESGSASLPPIREKSIAVLPFQNLSKEQENAFFAAGVQDEILTSLSHVADLKVISRTSVMQYKAVAKRNLREIGQQLGVAHVLEGSVQRVTNRVRVNAQLIDARTDTHVWAQTYDRDLADVFAIQSEIAQSIAGQLQAKISPAEHAAIAQAPTTDLVANALYAQARLLELKHPQQQSMLQAVRLLEEAIARDPQFLLAYCLLSRLHLQLFNSGYDHTPARRDLANAAIQSAVRLQPEAGEVHLALARYAYWGFLDYDRARAEVYLARRTLPNEAELCFIRGLLDRRQGRWTEATRNFDRAVELDPRNSQFLGNAGGTYEMLRRYSESSRLFERAIAVSPSAYFLRLLRASQPIFERADIRSLREEITAILAEQPEAAPNFADRLFWCAMAERDHAAVNRALAWTPAEGLNSVDNLTYPREWFAGVAARAFNDTAAARSSFIAARGIAQKLVHEQPDYAPTWSLLGQIDAALGRKEEAVREGRRACELLPLSKDAVIGATLVTNLARIYAWTGEKGLAFEQLAISAQVPGGVTYGSLKLDPQWDPLRGDPRFEKIVASLAPQQ